MCVHVGEIPLFHAWKITENVMKFQLERNHTSWWVCAWSGNRFPREFLDRRHMTAFLFANQTTLIDRFRHVPSTVEKLLGKAISTTTHKLVMEDSHTTSTSLGEKLLYIAYIHCVLVLL